MCKSIVFIGEFLENDYLLVLGPHRSINTRENDGTCEMICLNNDRFMQKYILSRFVQSFTPMVHEKNILRK